jgi:hypothetical protein
MRRQPFASSSRERVCCLLVLNTVTSTPQWIRQYNRCDGVSPAGDGGAFRGASVKRASSSIDMYNNDVGKRFMK